MTNADGSDSVTKTDYITATEPPLPSPPVAAFTGTPTSGDYPLDVQFTDQSTNTPKSWSWTFGDGGTSSVQNPSHTYSAAGTFTVTLTATNSYGSDAVTKTDYITATEPPVGGTMHVADIVVTSYGQGRWVYGTGTVTMMDDGGAPVSGATVYVTYTGPTSGSLSGVTGTDGKVSFSASRGTSSGWCFEVTNATHASLSYDSAANVVTKACESGYVFGAGSERLVTALGQNSPNPFNPMTVISFSMATEGNARLAIYDVRGQLVKELAAGSFGPGVHSFTWNAASNPSGVYFYRLETRGTTETRKMIMLK